MTRAERIEKAFEVPVLVAALLVVPLLALESAELGDAWRAPLAVADWAIWCVLLAEAVAMLAVVDDRRAWLRGHPVEVAVLLLTVPALAVLFPGVQALRLLRLLRLLRVAPIARRAFSVIGLRYATLLAALTALAGAEAFAIVEDESQLDSVYWALTTMATVGYGDVLPETDTGKLLAMAVMIVGIGFVAVLTGSIAERFISGDGQEAVEREEGDLVAELRAIGRRLDAIEARLPPDD